VPILQVYAIRVRDGRCSRSGKSVNSETVRDDLLQVSKAFTELGLADPRLNDQGIMDPRLTTLLKGMKNRDPASFRVKPMPIQVLHHAQSLVDVQIEAEQFVLDAAYIGFFYMLRPGEYLAARNSKPISLRNITFQAKAGSSVAQGMQALTSPIQDIMQAAYSAITFDDQKNRTKGETIAHGRTTHHLACPTEAIKRRVLHLRRHHAGANTPLLSLYHQGQWRTLKTQQLTQLLKRSAAAMPSLNYDSRDVTARSLRHGGAMALLLGGTDTDTVKLVGRWRSEAIFRYLHSQALPLIDPLATTMLRHGAFTLMPGGLTPAAAERLLQAYPPEIGQTHYVVAPPDEGDVDDTHEDILLHNAHQLLRLA
jgi:hypothetical protein